MKRICDSHVVDFRRFYLDDFSFSFFFFSFVQSTLGSFIIIHVKDAQGLIYMRRSPDL